MLKKSGIKRTKYILYEHRVDSGQEVLRFQYSIIDYIHVITYFIAIMGLMIRFFTAI